jgi:cytochrome P450
MHAKNPAREVRYILKGQIDSTVSYTSVPNGRDSWVFRFSKIEELLRGDTVCGLTVDDVNALFINDPDLVRAVQVKDSKNYARGDFFRKGRVLSQVGLLADNDAMHRHYRRLSNPFLRATKVDEYAPSMRRVVHEAVGSWRAGQVIDIVPELCRITGAIGLVALFPGLSPETEAALSDRVAELTWATIRRPIYATEISPSLLRQPSQERLAEAREEFRELLISYLDEQVRTTDGASSYPSALLSDSDESGNPRLTVSQVCDEALMMMNAATATMASTISWALYLLSEDPTLEKEVIEDLEKTRDEGVGRAGERASFGHTMRFLLEVLRIYPPVWIECRKTRLSVPLGDHLLPEGLNVVFSPYLLHRRAELYPDPSRFHPDRWLTLRPGEAEYIPFGLGPKVCPGESFAWLGLKVILDLVLREWSLSVKAGTKVEAAAGTTLHPAELLMIPQPR